MLTDNSFGVGFLRGLNSTSELFAPYYDPDEPSPTERMRSHWINVGEYLRRAMGTLLASVPDDVPEHRLSGNSEPVHPTAPPTTRIISAHWSGPLPPSGELERINHIIPGGADRLLCMAEKDLSMAEEEQTYRMHDTRRGQYLGWSLAMGAVVTATVVSLCHAPWQVSVALVGIPVLGSVQALIQGRKERPSRRPFHWF